MKGKIQKIENHLLSDGRAGIDRIDDTYSFYRFYSDDSPPIVDTCLTQDQAYERLANALRDDVLELD